MTDQYSGDVEFGVNGETVNVAFATALNAVYVESSACSNCLGSTLYDYTGEAAGVTPSVVAGAAGTAEFTHPLGLGADTVALTDDQVCLTNGGLCAASFEYYAITDYTFSGALDGETTWTNDATIDGWFGLGFGTDQENFMWVANQAGDSDYMQVSLTYTDEDTVTFQVDDTSELTDGYPTTAG